MDLEFINENGRVGINAQYHLWGLNLAGLLGAGLTGKSSHSCEASFGVLDSGFSHHDFRLLEEVVNGPAIGRSSGVIFWEKQRSYVTLTNIRIPLAGDGDLMRT
jgi:hypothetical protein